MFERVKVLEYAVIFIFHLLLLSPCEWVFIKASLRRFLEII
jgi:hypothetical protein